MRGTCRWCGAENAQPEVDESIGVARVRCITCRATGPEVTIRNPENPESVRAAMEEAWSQWTSRGAHWPNDRRTSDEPPTAQDGDASGYVMVQVYNSQLERMEWSRSRWATVAANPGTFPVWRAWPGSESDPRYGQEQPVFSGEGPGPITKEV